jgi:hypothetical protein
MIDDLTTNEPAIAPTDADEPDLDRRAGAFEPRTSDPRILAVLRSQLD